jgi:hypothetical protein
MSSRTLQSTIAGRTPLIAADAAEARSLAWVALQVIGLAILIRLLHIEGSAFFERVAPLAAVGAIVNHLLPPAHRLRFFGVLSLASVWLVFGLAEATWIVGIGLWLIVTCHLPLPFAGRMIVLAVTWGGLAALRAGMAPVPFSTAVWVVVGSMYMFRLIVYIYDLQHARQRTTWEERVAYFFAIPNVAFPLFPVIDFATFRRTYYDRPPLVIYRQGIQWMVRGLVHLVGYRIVYQYGVVDPLQISTGAQLVQFMVSTFLLYLRVSGQFHLIVGMLHLFGFRLPETHRFFYLASSFADLWKRINVYWKDFMQKVFYMPVYLPLVRKRGEAFAMVASTLVVFGATWLLHSYQWFWVLGTWHTSGPDVLFWTILAACLITNQWLVLRRGGPKVSVTGARRTSQLVGIGVRTAAMFAFMCVLWTLWSSRTLPEFVSLFRGVSFGWRDAAVIALVLGTVAAAAMLLAGRLAPTPARAGTAPSSRATLVGAAVLVGVWLAASPRTEPFVPARLHHMAVNVREGRLNARDQALQRRGYYEALNDVSRSNPELWRVNARTGDVRPGAPPPQSVTRRVSDARIAVVRPNLDQMEMGSHVRTNQWGMRDSAYAMTKGEGTWRIALFGPSIVFGTGVDNHETFEALVEARLNAEVAGRNGAPARFEVLNFAVPASSLWQHLASIRLGHVERFSPDVLLFVGARNELWNFTRYWQDLQRVGDTASMPELTKVLQPLNVTRDIPPDTAERRLLPVRDTLLDILYGSLVREARRLRALPVYGTIEVPLQRRDDSVAPLLQRASAAGFTTFDLSYVYKGRDERKLVLSESNAHPNEEGHRIIADALFRELTARPEVVGLRPAAAR